MLCDFCRFPETAGEFHDNLYDGLISICRKLLLKAFSCFDVNGYEELHSAPPVLYMGESAKHIGLHVCSQVMCGIKVCAVFFKLQLVFILYSSEGHIPFHHRSLIKITLSDCLTNTNMFIY